MVCAWANLKMFAHPTHVPAMTMGEYLRLLDGLVLPTSAQVAGFAESLAGAHSWYKHLPPWLPGRRFQIYLDPMLDEMRRLQFGGLAYRWKSPVLLEGQWALPTAIIEAGAVELTAAIHEFSQIPGVSGYHERHWMERGWSLADARWPEQSGGRPVLDRIIARCVAAEAEGQSTLRCDAELTRLLEPERQRQLMEIRQAADRVCALMRPLL